MTKKTDDVATRRAARLADMAAQRQEDAELDLPLLESLELDVPGIFADVRGRIESLLSKSAANGVSITPQIGNLNLVERSIMTAVAELKGEATTNLNPAPKG